ncbi:zeta toxin family protein [Candidatus Obscuribacterales bacterium]|nr:zeta toxin family protein [Candidatus Obscuribacterales bacterium]
MTPEDRALRSVISESYLRQQANYMPPSEWNRNTRYNVDNFIATGKLSIQDRLNLGMDRKSTIEYAATAAPEERAATRLRFTETERQIIDNASANGGKLSLADRIQLATSDIRGIELKPADFKAELEEMHKTPEGLRKLQETKDEFTRKYGRNMDDVVLSQVEDKQVDEFKRLLTPDVGDGRQTFYDNVWKALRSDSGAAADGTYLTMQRSIDQTANSLEEYQRIYQTLPPDKQKALDEYFNKSWEEHKQSKEKLADLVITATITAAALATAPFTAGMSVAALAAWAGVAATAGAAFTVGTKMAFTGNDYDRSHMMRDIVHGAVAGGLIFAIPPVGRVTAVFGQGAKTILADGALASSVAGLQAAERAAVEKALAESLMQAGKNFGQQEALTVLKQAAPGLGADATNKLATELVGSVARNYGTAIDAGVQALNQQAAEGGKQVATRLMKQMGESSLIGAGGNAVATLADAPFSEHGLDLKNLRDQTMLGGAIGLIMPVAFKGIAAGGKYVLNVSKEVNAASGAVDVVVHATPGEPVTVRRANGMTETITERGRLMDGDTIVDGPTLKEPTPGETVTATRTTTEALPQPTDATPGTKPGVQPDAAPVKQTDGQSAAPTDGKSTPAPTDSPQTTTDGAKPSTTNSGTPEQANLRRNEHGQLVNEQGRLVNERGQLVNDEGKLVNRQGKLVNERGQTINERGEIVDSKGNLIESEFPAYSKAEFDRVRPELVDDLHGWKTIDGKNVGEEFDSLATKLGMSETERNQILDGLQTVREHGTRMVDIDPEQAINWKHTQREFGAAVDYTARNNFSKAETQDLLLSAMFSDGLKTKFNFTTHNVDGATAFEHFAKTHLTDLPAERIAGIRQAILEHQVAPPEFMAMIYGGAIQGSIKAEGRALTEAETAAFDSLKAKISNPFALGPDGLIDVPGGPAGAKAVKLTPDEQALLQRTGLENWYVPNEGNTWNKFSRGLIDADGIDNYAGPGGLSKIIGLRGPGKAVFFQDRHVLYGNPENPAQISSVDSWKQSQRDFLGTPEKGKLGVATEQTRAYVEQQSARMQDDIESAQGRVNEWISSAEGRRQLGLPAEGPIEKVPGWTGSKEKPDLIDYSTATPEELDRARKIWDRFSEELGREQRVNLRTTPEYAPAMQKAADVRAAEQTANAWNQRATDTGTGVTLERAPSGENRWLVRRPDGSSAELHAEITSNPDGSQTVKYITDQRADWYQKAYERGAPESPMVREVTYHPDGSTTTKGFDAEFVPPEGSVLRKDARFGEYWSTPDGKQVWIDGERRVWNEVSKGVWQSKDGVLAENIEYVRKGLTTATPLDSSLEWTNSYNGVDTKMVAKAGDYRIDEGGGKFYVVDKDIFERVYTKAPGTENQYVKAGVRARESHHDQIVQTRGGDVFAKKGDFLATGPDGEIYVIEREKFHNLYERNATQPATPVEQFKMPEAIGPAVENADGTVTTPYVNGEIIWDKNKNLVTITDKLNGTSSTWSGEVLASQGVRVDPISGKASAFTEPVRFYFNNGAEERISSSGHRFVHTPDMAPGEFRGEDGAILRESGREAGPRSGETTFRSSSDSATGARQLTDSEGRVWTESNGQWVNDKGSLTIDEKGYRFTWNDGSANWTDADGRHWSRTAQDPPGRWTSNGSTYDEGSWNFTKRTKDDAHAPEILAALSPAAVAVAVTARANDGSNQDGTQQTDPRQTGVMVEGPSSARDVEVKADGTWTAKLEDGRVITPDSPGPWQVQLKNGTTLRRHDNSLEFRNPDGSGKVTIYDGKGGEKSFNLLPGGKYLDHNGKPMQYFSASETPPSTESFQFQKKATVKAEVATEPFEWTDWQGNTMQGAVGDIKVTQPDGALSSVKPDIFNSTYSPVEGQPGVYAKTAITNARQLQTDTAIPTLEGMGTGDKGDWLVTGPAGERYIVEGHKFNEFYRAVPKPADASPSFEFQKKASVRAEVASEPFEWKDWQGNPKTAKAGDWKVTQPDGTISSVEPSIFAKTYSEVPGKPGEYAKTAITNAQQLRNPTVINTKEGIGVGNRGDWLVTGPEGEQYIIEAKKFDELYRPAVGKVQEIPPPYKVDVESPSKDYIKSTAIKAEMVTEDNFKWTNHDAAEGHREQIAKKGDYKIYPADGSEFYVADGEFFRQNYHDMPGFPGKYAKTQAANAQVLEAPASVNNPDQGITSGVAGDYLVTDKNGLQYIVPKAKFESQYAPREATARAVEPMHLPPDTSTPVDMGDGTMHSTWEKGDIIRNTKDNSILVQNNETGEYQYYQGGRMVEEKRVIQAGDATKHQTIRYPYQDIDSVSRLPSPQEYNAALLKTEYQGHSLKQVKDEAMSMPDTMKDPEIIGTPELLAARQELQKQAVETRWNQLLSGEDATAKELDFGPPQQEKKARILMGLTGSGKTSSGMADLKGKGYMVLESDELKPMLPEYNGGVGATALRNESNMLNDQLLERAIADGYNFVLPGVGTNAEWMKETIKKLADAGWQVDLVFVDIPPAESMTRVVSRFQKEGRFVDPGFLVTHGHVPAQNYRQVVDDMFINGSGLTGYRHVWNYGRTPITLEEGSIH